MLAEAPCTVPPSLAFPIGTDLHCPKGAASTYRPVPQIAVIASYANVSVCTQAGLYDVLLCLADFCPRGGVRAGATRLLDALPTDAATLAALRGALRGPEPDQALAPLLAATRLARLLYTLQARSQSILACPTVQLMPPSTS